MTAQHSTSARLGMRIGDPDGSRHRDEPRPRDVARPTVLCHVTPGERRLHPLGDHLYGSGLPLTGNCRGIRLAALVAEHGFERITPEYGTQFLLPSEILAARTAEPVGTRSSQLTD